MAAISPAAAYRETVDFAGRKVLITGVGAKNGLGFAAARRLHSLGAKVVLTSLSDRAVERAAELPGAAAVCGDLTDEVFVQNLIDYAAEQMGGIDAVINNAGMTSILSPMQTNGESNGLAEMTVVAWEQALSRNLTSAFLVSKAALPHLRESGTGRIVVISSVTGAVMAMRNEVGYAAAKAGLIGFVRAVALDEAKYGITINAVSPGWIETDSQTADEKRQGLSTPIGRSGTADEVAAVITWLGSAEASYITGQNLVVDGGNSLAEERA